MATFLFHIKVIEMVGTDVVIEIRIITAEQTDFYSGRGFALMLLYDPIRQQPIRDTPLAHEVSCENVLDVDWLQDHVHEYIDDAVITDIRNYPIAIDLERISARQRDTFFRSNNSPVALFEITATRPEWIAHLQAGMEWDSTAYDPFL
jgi:hypothetical protein